MRRLGLLIPLIAGLLLVPGLVNAQPFQYKNLRGLENISDFIAGGSGKIKVAFENPSVQMSPLVASLEVTDEGERNVTRNNFWVDAKLKSKTKYPGEVYNISKDLDCTEGENGTFYCFNLSNISIDFCPGKSDFCLGEAKNVSYPVLPKSENNLTFYVRSNPALVPSNYSFNTTLYRKWEIIAIDDPVINYTPAGEWALFNASPSDVKVWVKSKVNQTLKLDAYLYSFTVQEQYPPSGKLHLKSVGLELNSSNVTDVKIRLYYNQSELKPGMDESSLKLYYFNQTEMMNLMANGNSMKNAISDSWQPVDSTPNTTGNYVTANTGHLSLYSIFGEPKTQTKYVTTTETNTEYINKNRTKYKNRTVEVEKETLCGNDECEYDESWETCPADCEAPTCPDCPEPTGWSACTNGTQTRMNYHCSGETGYKCESYTETQSCKVKEKITPSQPKGITGKILANPAPFIIGILFIIFLIVVGLFRRKR